MSIVFNSSQSHLNTAPDDLREQYYNKIYLMFGQISNDLQLFLDNTTYIYKQNGIKYQVKYLHSKFMHFIKPPANLLDFQNCSFEEEVDSEQQSAKRKEKKEQNRIQNLSEKRKEQYENVNKIFCGKKLTPLDRKVKQFELAKGNQMLKASLKFRRHVRKFTETFEERQKRKKDPFRVPLRRQRNQRSNSDKKTKGKKQSKVQFKEQNGRLKRRGRKIDAEGYQTKTFNWARQKLSKGQRIRQSDIKNFYRTISHGKYSGSSGWCSRFLSRYPVLQRYFKKLDAVEPKFHEENFQQNSQQMNNWIQPQNYNSVSSEQQESGQDLNTISGCYQTEESKDENYYEKEYNVQSNSYYIQPYEQSQYDYEISQSNLIV